LDNTVSIKSAYSLNPIGPQAQYEGTQSGIFQLLDEFSELDTRLQTMRRNRKIGLDKLPVFQSKEAALHSSDVEQPGSLRNILAEEGWVPPDAYAQISGSGTTIR
jgi:hypothetical protein